jgi:general stress protein YciG
VRAAAAGSSGMWGSRRRAASKARHGDGFDKSIGRKGGETTKQRHGPQFYEKIGRKGGQTMKKLIEQGKRAAKKGR